MFIGCFNTLKNFIDLFYILECWGDDHMDSGPNHECCDDSL